MSRESADLTVLVVGGAGGIGGAIARRLISRGARVGVADVDAAALERLRGALSIHGEPVPAWAADVRDPAALGRLRDDAVRAFGGLDAVVNCAAVIHPGPVETLPPDGARHEVEVNLLGTMHVARAFVPYFRARGAGHLILFASLGGVVPMPGGSVYAATKFGVRGFTLSLALELRGSGVSVSVVCPDSTDTPMLRAEALAHGSLMSFASAPLRAEAVAAAVERTLRRPRMEILVPPVRGLVGRIIAFSPVTLRLLAPLVQWLGRHGHRKYLDRLDRGTAPPALPLERA
jgi:NAD(P)-dependent dehydrogenase (short-subunit alcohol dehydrogenase family)